MLWLPRASYTQADVVSQVCQLQVGFDGTGSQIAVSAASPGITWLADVVCQSGYSYCYGILVLLYRVLYICSICTHCPSCGWTCKNPGFLTLWYSTTLSLRKIWLYSWYLVEFHRAVIKFVLAVSFICTFVRSYLENSVQLCSMSEQNFSEHIVLLFKIIERQACSSCSVFTDFAACHTLVTHRRSHPRWAAARVCFPPRCCKPGIKGIPRDVKLPL